MAAPAEAPRKSIPCFKLDQWLEQIEALLFVFVEETDLCWLAG